MGLGANLTLVLLMDGKDTAPCWNSGIWESWNPGILKLGNLKTRSAGFLDFWLPRFQDSIFAYVLSHLFSLVAAPFIPELSMGDAEGWWKGISDF